LLTRLDVPRYLLLATFLAVAVLAPVAIAPRVAQVTGVGVLAVALLLVAGLGGRAAFTHPQAKAKIVSTNVKTAFYVLRVRSYEGLIPQPATRGGGLNRLGDHYLLGTGDGHLYALRVA